MTGSNHILAAAPLTSEIISPATWRPELHAVRKIQKLSAPAVGGAFSPVSSGPLPDRRSSTGRRMEKAFIVTDEVVTPLHSRSERCCGLLPNAAAVLAQTWCGFLLRLGLDLTGAPMNASELRYYTLLLGNGAKRTEVVEMLTGSQAHRLGVGRSTYASLLGREPEPAESCRLIQAMKSGLRHEQLVRWLAGSEEYFALAGRDEAKFLDRLYCDLLGRRPLTSEQVYFLRLLTSGAERSEVAGILISSAEYRQQVVRDCYQQLLNRLPEEEELRQLTGLLKSGLTYETILTRLPHK
ncbi:MAG TPA: DUF4214 domain-containing protein [Blastocatellia bacterium]|nr:DUF4214 domain-containing protein [Blastocatellia bacterium]